PPTSHASQQLGQAPGVPPRLAHISAFRTIWHPTDGTQHVMKFGFPQIDLAAQRRTRPRQPGGRSPAVARSFATRVAQRTYAPWLAAPSQSQSAATCAFAAASAAAPPGSSRQAANADDPAPKKRGAVMRAANTKRQRGWRNAIRTSLPVALGSGRHLRFAARYATDAYGVNA